ncbi:patatin, partial [mine drainage metagenome]
MAAAVDLRGAVHAQSAGTAAARSVTREPLRAPRHTLDPLVTTERPAYWEHVGDLIETLIASMSLPGIFPPVELDGRPHIDGAMTNNLPVDQATENGAQTTVSILCNC